MHSPSLPGILQMVPSASQPTFMCVQEGFTASEVAYKAGHGDVAALIAQYRAPRGQRVDKKAAFDNVADVASSAPAPAVHPQLAAAFGQQRVNMPRVWSSWNSFAAELCGCVCVCVCGCVCVVACVRAYVPVSVRVHAHVTDASWA